MSPVVRIQPADGLDTESAPEFVQPNAAPVLRNLLAHKTGRLIQRGGLATAATITTNGAGPIGGPWWAGSTLVFSAPDAGGTGKLHTATVNTLGAVTYAGVNASLSVAAKQIRSSFTRLDDSVYGIAVTPTNSVGLLRFKYNDFTAAIILGAAPVSPIDLATYASRIFVLGGTKPGAGGTSTVYQNHLYWTDPGGGTVGGGASLPDWQDDVSGLTNDLIIPDDRGIGLAVLSSGLVIFMNNSVHMLTGSGGSSFSRKQVLWRGATNTDAICTVGDGVYFLARDGVYYFDGAQERKVSAAVESNTTQIDGKAMTGVIREIGNDYLYVATYDAVAGPNPPALRWQGLYHTKSGTWTEFTTAAMTDAFPAAIGAYDGHVVALDRSYIWNASRVTAQSPASVQSGRDTRVSTTFAIDTAWTTRVLRLAGPTNKAHVRRIILDYQWATTFDPGMPPAWSYRICTAPVDFGDDLTTVLATGTIAADGNFTTARQRASIELHAEAEDLWLEITHNQAATGGTISEIYDVWVEYDVAQQSRGY